MYGNTALSVEILDMIFLYLGHDDLSSLLLVCKTWAAVAAQPKLWADFRPAYAGRHNEDSISQLLGLKRMQDIKFIIINSPSDKIKEAVMNHPGIVKVKFRDVYKPRKTKGNHVKSQEDAERYSTLLQCVMDKYYHLPRCSKVQEVRIQNCVLERGQLLELLEEISEGRTSIKVLSLSFLKCDGKSPNSIHGSFLGCVPYNVLGKATKYLTKLTLDGLDMSLGWQLKNELESFYQAITEETSLKELILKDVSISYVNPKILVTSLCNLEKLIMSGIHFTWEHSLELFTALQNGNIQLKEISIYAFHGKGAECHSICKLETSLLARAINNLERVALYNLFLNTEQVTSILSMSLVSTKLKELKLDRYDSDHSHLLLPLKLMEDIKFTFEFNDGGCKNRLRV